MSLPIEDYALISDCYTGALVGRDGSIDWLCLPRYDSASMFGAILGTEEQGRWLLAPTHARAESTRRYDGDSMILITNWVTPDGEVEVVDLMPQGDHRADVIRRVRGIRGRVEMHEELRIRFGYADALPWVRKEKGDAPRGLLAVSGPDAIIVRGPELKADGRKHVADFTVEEGETVDIRLTWFASHKEPPPPLSVDDAITTTRQWWSDWAARTHQSGDYSEQVIRSLVLLRALTHNETGGIVAAATTSLPESFGGPRNWDYRYVWLRDASLTISVLLSHGYHDVVNHWRQWMLRAVAGDPHDVQIMYGLSGERDLLERELTSLPGYQGSSPVRVGNAAAKQFQADVIGETMVALHEARRAGIKETEFSWSLQRALVGFLETEWEKPDQGIWEIRGEPRHFTHSRVMVWAAFDRAARAVREYGLKGPVEKWEELREKARQSVEEKGFSTKRNSYTQYFGTTQVDASLLQLPQVGYCAPDDPRMLGTVAAIEEDLIRDGLPLRYLTEKNIDGLPPGEHPFLACAFWLVEQYAGSGRVADARALMDRLMSFANDVGMFSEEYDVEGKRQVGNTPQALSHLAMVRAADAINSGNHNRPR
ncbi:glycoside hydrolase family 15 protein [Microbacterium sp. STN6]|uniref:glycoside hydrolase family 15 protein n=1 Tax=Microbacterium sp. STN6 TaxID=2995588 RepID=UPI002260CA0E|nr:glycoside hydrolase family 15 protein [Microbacterium sp. STN6]MCX7522031.1 glycoside hydrolase family 15 protein [Microbacterium sp. STN6]